MEYLEGATLAERLEAGDSHGERDAGGSCGRSAARSRPRTGRRSSTAISSRRTSGSPRPSATRTRSPSCSTSASPSCSTTGEARARRPARRWGRRATCRPSSARARPVDHRADIYSLGIILYELFAGTAAVSGRVLRRAHLPADVGAARASVAPSPDGPGAGADHPRCLEKEPAKRPESAKELGRLLDLVVREGNEPLTQLRPAVLSTRPSAAAGTTMGQSIGEVVVPTAAPAPGARRRVALATAGAAALVVVVVALLSSNGRLDRQAARGLALDRATAARRGDDPAVQSDGQPGTERASQRASHDRAPAAAYRRGAGRPGEPRRARGRAGGQRRRLRRGRRRARTW